MENGFDFSFSSSPGAAKSMMKSWRPSTSRPREQMIQRRVSEGSTGRRGELLIPSDAFHRLRDSSSWSAMG